MEKLTRTFLFLLTSLIPAGLDAHFKTEAGMPVHITPDCHLEYGAYPNGDRVPDYSWCGYKLSTEPIPTVPAVITVAPPADGSDATQLLQQAIDHVASMPLQADGFRGAIELEAGTFHVGGQLLIRHSGIVLRGAAPTTSGTASSTELLAEGFSKDELIRVLGSADVRITSDTLHLSADYIPAGTHFIPATLLNTLRAGDRVRITRPCTAEWLALLGTDRIGHQQEYNFSRWAPGQYEQQIERTVTAVESGGFRIDAPLPISLDANYGGGLVIRINPVGRIHHIGIEQIAFRSTFDASNPKDECHRWQAVTFDHVEDGWVRRITARHFAGSAVMLLEGARCITVEDCRFLAPVSEEANHRRYAFHTCGQLTLFQRCYSESGYHSFAVGRDVAGPNAFVQCHDEQPLSYSGATGGMSSAILFDRCTLSGGTLCYDYRDIADRGAAWTTCNSMCWATRASQTHIVTPPEAHNWGYGLWTQPFGDGYYQCSHTFVKPESLFYAQLAARTDSCEQARIELSRIYRYTTDESARTTPDYAHLMSLVQQHDDMRMDEWIDSVTEASPLVAEIRGKGPKAFVARNASSQTTAVTAPTLTLTNGWITRGGKVLTNGSRPGRSIPSSDSWRGTGSLTQFYPGHYGHGYTMEPDSLVARLAASGGHAMAHHMALWYDYRRNDHERNAHADADAWAPFNESPWCRTGIGQAQDRLSRYDLGRFNPWYFARLRQFVEGADREGLLLLNEHYFQHNIIEEGAHWCDYPWRAANNVNNAELGFAERQQFAGDKRVYMAEAFYDVEGNAAVRHYHDLYIRRTVETFTGLNGVIHSLGLEYTGPLHFTRFWLETVSSIPQHQLVSLVGTKDVADAILSDPHFSPMVDVIDIRHWHYRNDSSLYAPAGGQSLAPRQWARIIEPGQTDCASIYHAIREYRERYPEKAVTYNVSTARPDRRQQVAAAWTILLAGGSLAPVPPCDDVPDLWQRVTQMQPLTPTAEAYMMGAPGAGYVAYVWTDTFTLPLQTDAHSYTLYWVDAATGAVIGRPSRVRGGRQQVLKAPRQGVVCILL